MIVTKPEQVPELRRFSPEERKERWRAWWRWERLRDPREWLVLGVCLVGYVLTGIVVERLLLIREIHGTAWHYAWVAVNGGIWWALVPMQWSIRRFRRRLRREGGEPLRSPDVRPRRGRVFVGIVAAIAALSPLVALAAWHHFPLAPIFADRPYHGEPAAPIEEPVNRGGWMMIGVFGGRSLDVIDPADPETSPLLQLRDRDGAILWTIRVDAERPGEIRRIRVPMELLFRSRIGLARSGVVIGEVESDDRTGRLYLFITRDGALRDYWVEW